MFRPNRIGDHAIVDLSADDYVFLQTAANYVTNQGTLSVHHVQSDNATLGDPVTCVNFDTGETVDDNILATLKSFSFGRFVSGAPINEREVMYCYSANLTIHLSTTQTELQMELYAGVTNASTITVDITAQTNQIDQKAMLANKHSIGNTFIHSLSARGYFINTLFNGGASGAYDTNPLGLYYAITNMTTGNITIERMVGSLGLYKYSRDIDTFDPNR